MAYEQERLIHAIDYIALIHKKAAKKWATQTYIYKYLALIDFTSLKETGRPVFDLAYEALKMGPVPVELFEKRELLVKTDPYKNLFHIVKEENGTINYKPVADPDLDYFSDYEINLIETTVERFAHPGIRISVLEEATHRQIRAWRVAWENRGGSGKVAMNPLETFPGIARKNPETLTPEQEVAIAHYVKKQRF